MGKRGISTVVATLLIILMTIIAAVMLWIIIPTFFKPTQELNSEDVDLEIELNGRTVYDPVQGIALVQISRGSDHINLGGIEVFFEVNGNSIVYVIEKSEVPNPNERRTYSFSLTRNGVQGVPETVSIVPIVLSNEKKVPLKPTSPKAIPIGSTKNESAESYNNESSS